MVAIFPWERKVELERQRVLCLNCSDLKEKNLKRLEAQLEQLAKGDNTLLLQELAKKRDNFQEKIFRIQKMIAFAQDKTQTEKLIAMKRKEKDKWERRRIWETLKIGNDYSTTLCGCGCAVSWASRHDRPYGTKKFISAKRNEQFLKKKREKQKLVEGLRAKGIDVKILKQSKVARSLDHHNHAAAKSPDIEKFQEMEEYAKRVDA